MELILIKSEEVKNPLKNGQFFRFKCVIEMEGDLMKGRISVVGMDYLFIEKTEKTYDGDDITAEAAAFKFWLEADLTNLIIEFDDNMGRLNG
jgi:2,3-bisphosphoglycerate-independent phosphoglycerate mutase